MSVKTKTAPKGLTFTHNGHRYKLDGLPVTGVTTILNGGVPKPALVYWAGKTVAEYVEANPLEIESLRAREDVDFVRELAGIPAKIRDDAGVTGTAVHDFAEALAATGTVEDVPDELAGYVEGYADFLDRFQITPLLMERPCAIPQGLVRGQVRHDRHLSPAERRQARDDRPQDIQVRVRGDRPAVRRVLTGRVLHGRGRQRAAPPGDRRHLCGARDAHGSDRAERPLRRRPRSAPPSTRWRRTGTR